VPQRPKPLPPLVVAFSFKTPKFGLINEAH
jgi:hypothetical protein